MKNDWANLKKYENENTKVKTDSATSGKVVLIGGSITELWKATDPDFFTNTIINRGISEQTTPQMLLRFH